MLAGKVQVVLNLKETKTQDFSLPNYALDQSYLWSIATGVGVDQADLLFADQRTLGASANEDLDLAGVLASAFGATLTFAKLRLLYIKAADANPANLTLSRPASNGALLFAAASDAIVLEPGADFLYRSPKSGKAITATTADLLNIASGAGGNHVYDVFIIGTSA